MAETDTTGPDDSRELRRRAEREAAEWTQRQELPSPDRLAELVHELQVHQIELEMQNESLRLAQAELESARDRFADLYDFAPVGYVTLDEQSNIREVNLTACDMLGRERGRLLGNSLVTVTPHRDRSRLRKYLQQCRQACPGQGVEAEVTLHGHGNSDSLALLRTVASVNPVSGEREYRMAITDVSKQRRAEQALHESEQRLALAADKTELGMFDWDIETGQIAATERKTRLLGLTTTTTTTTTLSQSYHRNDWMKRVHPSDLPRVEEETRRTMSERVPYEVEYRIIWPNGRVRWLATRGVFQYNEQGHPQRMLGVSMDITDRKRIEELLQKEHSQLETVLRQLPVGVIIAEAPSGKLIRGNEEVERIWKHGFIQSGEIGHYEAYKGFHPDGRPYLPHEWPLARTITTGEHVEQEEIRFQRGDGTLGWLNVNAAPIRDAQGNIIAGVVTFTDITARKLIEEELKQRLEQLHMANEDLARFNRAAVGRELRMIELKKEVNELCAESGKPRRYLLELEEQEEPELETEPLQRPGS